MLWPLLSLGAAVYYILIVVSYVGLFGLELVGSRWNKPAIVIALAFVWPISVPFYYLTKWLSR